MQLRHIFYMTFLLLPCWLASMTVQADAVVFMYHRFGEARLPSTNITLDQFDAQLQHLADAGYSVWPLPKIVATLQRGEAIPDRTIGISIDDAYASIYHEAYPRLKDRRWPFTVFVSTDPIDRGLKGYMSWEQMREMQSQHTVHFANHSASHDHLIERRHGESERHWAQRIEADIARARDRLKTELNAESNLFAYPYGEYDQALVKILKQLGYSVAFGQQSGAIGTLTDLTVLPRYPMAEAYGELKDFRLKAASLALPVVRTDPWSPILHDLSPPRLIVDLGESSAQLKQLNCFATAQGQLQVDWVDAGKRFAIQAPDAWPTRRARYNCTAPGKDGRFYWYSHLWIMPEIAE